jgi:TolB protein
LAFETDTSTGEAESLWLDTPGHPATPVSGLSVQVGGFAWSPDGSHLAVVTGHNGNGKDEGPLSTLQVVPVDGGSPTTWFQSTESGIDIAGWWPNGDGLLFWVDTGYSESVAADGIPLYSQVEGGQPREIGPTLVNTSWVSWSPDGHTVAVVAGGDRFIWGGSKHVVTCDPTTATCTPVDTPAGTVTLSPTWSPAGVLSVVVASASGPFSPDGGAYFSDGWLAEWDSTHALFVSAPGGLTPLSAQGTGIVADEWGVGGVLSVRHDSLWFGGSGGSLPALIAGPLFSTVAPTGYYGQVDWSSMFAWHNPGVAPQS